MNHEMLKYRELSILLKKYGSYYNLPAKISVSTGMDSTESNILLLVMLTHQCNRN